MRGYWHNPQASAETLRGGWLHTGDLGTFDNAEPIGCPHKMLCPALCARIEQWHHGLCLGIKHCGEVVAIAITALAGQREVVETM